MLTLPTSVLSFINGGIISEQYRLTSWTLAGPTVTRLVQVPLAVLSLDNPLCILVFNYFSGRGWFFNPIDTDPGLHLCFHQAQQPVRGGHHQQEFQHRHDLCSSSQNMRCKSTFSQNNFWLFLDHFCPFGDYFGVWLTNLIKAFKQAIFRF